MLHRNLGSCQKLSCLTLELELRKRARYFWTLRQSYVQFFDQPWTSHMFNFWSTVSLTRLRSGSKIQKPGRHAPRLCWWVEWVTTSKKVVSSFISPTIHQPTKLWCWSTSGRSTQQVHAPKTSHGHVIPVPSWPRLGQLKMPRRLTLGIGFGYWLRQLVANC